MAADLSTRTFGTVQCGVCDQAFVSRSPRSVYCGSECKVTARRAHARKRDEARRSVRPTKWHERGCRRCLSPFRTEGPYQHYCPSCVAAAESSGRTKYHFLSRKAAVLPEQRICKGCREPFGPSVLAQEYCGRECWTRHRRTVQVAVLNGIMRSGIRRSLRRSLRGAKWEEWVGYDAARLAGHLERQFLPKMSWENQGEWHIDHIVPLSSFDFTSPDDPEFRAAWALTNLRPLWAKDNLRKGARRSLLL